MRPPLSIARIFRAGALVALVGLTVVACESGRPTTPTTPTSPAALPATNLAGTWEGTARVSWDEIDGGGGCSGPVTVTFAHSGSTVSATLGELAGCLNGPLRFEGTLTGNVLEGKIIFPSYSWITSGQASENHVTMAATNVAWDIRR